jgi:hypothetical protein
MGWESFTSRDGIYLVNWGGVTKIIRSCVRSAATLANAQVRHQPSFSTWLPLVRPPDVTTLDVDWDRVRSQTESESEAALADFYQAAKYGMQVQISRLHCMIAATRANNANFQAKMHEAQKQTMASIDKSVGRAENVVTGLKLTRDFSAEFLMVGATFLSGGAAAPLLAVAGGSGLKAAAKYEDSTHPDIKDAAVTFVTEFAVGVIDLGAGKGIESAAAQAFKSTVGTELEKEAAKRGTELGLAILYTKVKGATIEPGKAIIEGDTLQKAFTTGALKGIGSDVELLKYFFLDPKMKKMAALVDTTFSVAMDRLGDRLSEPGDKEPSEPPKMQKPSTPQHALIDAVVFDSRTIEQLAVRKIGSMSPAPQPGWQHVKAAGGFARQ